MLIDLIIKEMHINKEFCDDVLPDLMTLSPNAIVEDTESPVDKEKKQHCIPSMKVVLIWIHSNPGSLPRLLLNN